VIGDPCVGRALDAQQRARLCNEPGVTAREIRTVSGDVRILMPFCAVHAAERDAAKQRPADGYGGDVDLEFVVTRRPGYTGPCLLEQIRRGGR
jgi:hypothetical protein